LFLSDEEIAKSQNVPYEPDTDILRDDEVYCAEEATSGSMFHNQEKCLIDLGHNNNDNRNTGMGPSGGSGGGGFGAFSAPPPLPSMPPSAPYPSGPNTKPIGFNFGDNTQMSSSAPAGPPPHYDSLISNNESDPKKGMPSKDASSGKPTPVPRSSPKSNDTLPELPAVPTGSLPDIPTDGINNSKDDSIDFEDLTKRFEELKKRK
jgi:hypothetical protein